MLLNNIQNSYPSYLQLFPSFSYEKPKNTHASLTTIKTPHQISNLSPVLLLNITSLLVLTHLSSSTTANEDDLKCLKGVKKSFTDPQNKLTSWTFTNTSVGSICHYDGITCWSDKENRVLDLQLRDFQLSGAIPDSLKFCSSLQTLDLSKNSLYGSIPTMVCTWLPYLVTLDLSNNELSGQIPPDLGNCKFLNKLNLASNNLHGSIPNELSNIQRLNTFSIAGNALNGLIPGSLWRFNKSSFEGNSRLCGGPMRSCDGLSKRNLGIIIVAGVFGAVGSLLLSFGLWLWCFRGR